MKRKFVALLSCALLFTSCGGSVQPEPGPQPDPEGKFYIRIQNKDGHFHPVETTIPYVGGDLSLKSVRFQIDDDYVISNYSVFPNNAADCAHDGDFFYIKPNRSVNFTVTVSTIMYYRSITFNPGPSGSQLGEDASEVVKAPLGSYWDQCFDQEKQVATWQGYDFAGWSATNDSLGHGTIIDPSSIITKNTSKNVYGSYVHHVNLTSESIEIRRFDYGYKPNFRIYLSLKDSIKYDFPTSKEAFNITNSSDGSVSFNYETDADERYISFTNPNEVSDGIINIVVTNNRPKYDVTDKLSGDSGKHLKVVESTLEDATKGDDYTFTIEAINSTNEEPLWYIPDELKLTHGPHDFPIGRDGYQIIIDAGSYYQKATVTIFGDHVNGDIKIDGVAARTDAYYYTFTGYGVSVDEGKEEGVIINGYGETELALGGDASSVTADNVAVVIDNITYAYNELSDHYKYYIYFNPENKHFYLRPGFGLEVTTIHIHVMSPNYQVFEKSSWQTINEICEEGLAEIFFVVGEVKHNIQIGNNTYSARIIGFNHDTLVSSSDKKAALTIEFVELITDNGVLHKDIYSGQYIGVFNGGVYDKYLNNEFMDKLPTELSSVIKKVEKKVTTYKEPDPRTYQTKIFPLSMSELDYYPEYYKSEGATYEYYDNQSTERAKKCPCGSSNPAEYWTRSHSPSFMDLSYKIKTNGNHDDDYMQNKYGYMAAFCI